MGGKWRAAPESHAGAGRGRCLCCNACAALRLVVAGKLVAGGADRRTARLRQMLERALGRTECPDCGASWQAVPELPVSPRLH